MSDLPFTPGSAGRTERPDEHDKRKARELALRLHNAGLPKGDIAEQTGIPYGRVKEEIVAAMRDQADEPVEYRAMAQMAMMRDLQRAFYTPAIKGDVKAFDRLMKICDHEAKLLGLYAPQRLQAVIGAGASEYEFAVVAEVMLKAAGRNVPRHIAAAAADGRAQGVLPPVPVVIDDAESA